MPLYREIEESTCRVTWFRLVEADTLAEAVALFADGEGAPDGQTIGDYCGPDPKSTVVEVGSDKDPVN